MKSQVITLDKHIPLETLLVDSPNTHLLLPLGHGLWTRVDKETFEWAQYYSWHAVGKMKQQYATCGTVNSPLDRKRLSRILLDAPPHLAVDHINGDTLDNRRCNLRLATASENAMNRRKKQDASSQYKGVYKRPYGWCASICINQKSIWVGTFKTEVAAAQAWDRAARELHGQFARLNFPEDSA